MIKITFITTDGENIETKGESGATLLELASEYDVEGIKAECGGACACATCHVYLDSSYMDKVTKAEQHEEEMISILDDYDDYSRLACQVTITDEMHGMKVRVAEN